MQQTCQNVVLWDLVNNLQEVNSIFLNQNLTLAVRDVNKRYFLICYSLQFNLHFVVHGKIATKLKVKSGSLYQVELFHSEEAKGPVPVRG